MGDCWYWGARGIRGEAYEPGANLVADSPSLPLVLPRGASPGGSAPARG